MSLILNLTLLEDKLRTARYLRDQLYKFDTEQNETIDEKLYQSIKKVIEVLEEDYDERAEEFHYKSVASFLNTGRTISLPKQKEHETDKNFYKVIIESIDYENKKTTYYYKRFFIHANDEEEAKDKARKEFNSTNHHSNLEHHIDEVVLLNRAEDE